MKSKRALFIVVLALLLGIFSWIFTIDRNPPVDFHPTDGMAMYLDFSNQLTKDGGAAPKLQTPAEYVNFPGNDPVKTKPFVVEWIQYVKGAPDLLNAAMSLIGRPRKVPRVEVTSIGGGSDGLYFEYKTDISGGGGFIADENVRMLNICRELRRDLHSLPENSPIHIHSSFFLVQLGADIRIFEPQSLPDSLEPMRKVLTDLDQFKAETHIGD